MSNRTGIVAEVPTLELCREMAAIPALAEAFKESTLTWWMLTQSSWGLVPREHIGNNLPAPTVREMLAWLDDKWGKGFDLAIGKSRDGFGPVTLAVFDTPDHSNVFHLSDPDALARACLEAVKP